VIKINPEDIASVPAISGGAVGVSAGIPLGENARYWDGDSYVESSLVEYPPAEPQAAAVVNNVLPAVAADESANAGAAAAPEVAVELVFDT
jgi:hypothetical protein